jgi:hypothetical protein
MTKSLGTLGRMVNTRPSRHMRYSVWVLLSLTCTTWFGRIGLLQSINLLLGPVFKIVFERRSVWTREDGKIMILALCASKPRNRCTTYSSIAGTSYVFVNTSRNGSVSPKSTPPNGKALQSSIGGTCSQMAQLQTAKQCLPSPCSSFRRFGASGMLECLEIILHRLFVVLDEIRK